MNRYKRSLTQVHHPGAHASELSLGHSGAGPSMYFIDDNEPKRPNIISRGKMRISSPSQSSAFVVNPNVNNVLMTAAGPQTQQLNYQLTNQHSQSVQVQGQTMQQQHQNLNNVIPEPQTTSELLNIISTNSGALRTQLGEVPVCPTTTATMTAVTSEGENLALDAIPFHLLSDENTQTFLNSGQFETIETEDGNVLLILKEDIENPAVGDNSTIANTLSLNSELATPAAAPNYPLIDHDVTTCTLSIEAPISSDGVNTSVVQHRQEQKQIEQQQHQLDSSLIQMTQQQLETIDLSEQLIVNTSDGNGIQPQSYFLLQMSDGTSYLVPTDSVEGAEAEAPEAAIHSTLSEEAVVPEVKPVPASMPVTPAATARKPKPVAKPVPTQSTSTPFKIQLQSQPPPLVPVRRKEIPAPTPEHQKPYRFIMSEEGEERPNMLPLNPFVVKVLSQPPVSSPRQPKETTPTTTTSTGLSSPPKLILKTPFSVSASQLKPVSTEPIQTVKAEAKLVDPVTSNATVTRELNVSVSDDGVIDLGTGLFKCSRCEKRTKLRVNMLNHINRSHKGERPYPCPDCGETFQYASTLRAHHQKIHVIKVYKCVPCAIHFATEADLKSHFTSVHSTQKNVVVVSSSSSTNNSFFSSLDNEKFTCEKCKKQYTSKNNLMRHKIDHWDMSTGSIPCDECMKTFASKVNYLNHVQAHKDSLLEHTCETCAKGFKTEQYLRNHMLIHQKATSIDKTKPDVKQEKTNGTTIVSSSLTPGITAPAPAAKKENNVTTTPVREPPVIKFLSASQSQSLGSEEKLPETPPLPKAKRQVFLCSRCDVIFTTSDQLKTHFDEKHPHLIGKQQVVLKSTRVPATFLEKKLSQQKLDASKLSAPTSPAQILETLKCVAVQGSPTRLLEKTASAIVSPPKSTNNAVGQNLRASPVKIVVPLSPAKAVVIGPPVKKVVPASPVKGTSPGSPAKVPLVTGEHKMLASPVEVKPTQVNQASKEKNADEQSSPRESVAAVPNSVDGNTPRSQEKITVKSMAEIAQVQMKNKLKNNAKAKRNLKSVQENNKEKPSSPVNKRARKSPAPETKAKVAQESETESPKGQSRGPSPSKSGPEVKSKSPTPKKEAVNDSTTPAAALKTPEARKIKSVSPNVQTRVSTRQNKGQSTKNTDFEFYANNPESGISANANITSPTETTPAVKRKVGRPPKRPAPPVEEKTAPSSPTKNRKISSPRAFSPDITASTSTTKPTKVNQTNGRAGGRISTRGSTGRQK